MGNWHGNLFGGVSLFRYINLSITGCYFTCFDLIPVSWGFAPGGCRR